MQDFSLNNASPNPQTQNALWAITSQEELPTRALKEAGSMLSPILSCSCSLVKGYKVMRTLAGLA